MFIRIVAEFRTQPCFIFVEKRCGVVIRFMATWKGGFEDLTREILRHFEACGFLNPAIIQSDKEMSIIDMCRKVAHERNERKVLRFAPKTNHQTFFNSTRTCSLNHFHLPFHLRLVTIELFSQDSQCDPTVEPHSNSCLELHMYHICACLVNQHLRWSPTLKWGHSSWRTDGSDASFDERMVVTKHGLFKCSSVRRNFLESGGADVKWNLDVDNGLTTGGFTSRWRSRQQRHRWKFVQYFFLFLRQKTTYLKFEVFSNSGGGDVAAKTGIVMCDPSYADLSKSKVRR